MQMAADFRKIAHPREKAVVEMPGVRAGEPDARDALDIVHRLEQSDEVTGGIVRRLVVVDDLAEQLYFLVPARGRFTDFGEDVRLRAHTFVSARIRHDTEAAEFVAAFDDRDVRL